MSVSLFVPDDNQLPSVEASAVAIDPPREEVVVSATVAESASTSESPTVGEVPPTDEQLRQLALQAIEAASLPRGLRGVLAAAFAEQKPLIREGDSPLLPLDQALAAIQTVLPSQWLADSAQLAQLPHPLGNHFFDGNHDALTDERATAIAREQLQRVGFLSAA